MKLFEVNIEAKAYVWAEDYRAAERIAAEEIREIMDDAEIDAYEIKPGSPVYSGYEASEPFGEAPEAFDGMVLSEIREKMAEEDAKVDRETLPLPGVSA